MANQKSRLNDMTRTRGIINKSTYQSRESQVKTESVKRNALYRKKQTFTKYSRMCLRICRDYELYNDEQKTKYILHAWHDELYHCDKQKVLLSIASIVVFGR